MPIFDTSQNIEFYNKNAEKYKRDTEAIRLAELYDQFTAYLPAGGLILDAGCGPGRDLQYFAELGFIVCGFDNSEEMVRLASQGDKFAVRQLHFQDLEDLTLYDGIWACASLLHVPYIQLPDVFRRLRRALKPGGILMLSMKYGQGEIKMRGRWFTLMDETHLASILHRVGGLSLLQQSINRDERPGRVEYWLNAILQRFDSTER